MSITTVLVIVVPVVIVVVGLIVVVLVEGTPWTSNTRLEFQGLLRGSSGST